MGKRILDDERQAELDACLIIRETLKTEVLAKLFGITEMCVLMRARRLKTNHKVKRI